MKNIDLLEKKLQDFCNVSPPYKFSLRLEEEKVKSKNIKPFVSVACAALVLVCALAFAVGFGKTDIQSNKPEEFGFVINAHAEGAENNIATVGTESTKVSKEYSLINKDYEKVSALSVDHIALELTGNDIVSYDLKAKNGILHFRDDLHRLSANNVIEGGRVFDYFVAGSELYDLPVDTEETYLFWLPGFDRIEAVAATFEEQCEILQTAEDYNKYFGDTITLTVEYKDGTNKSVDIEISFDDEAYAYAKMSAVDANITMY